MPSTNMAQPFFGNDNFVRIEFAKFTLEYFRFNSTQYAHPGPSIPFLYIPLA